MARKGHKNLFLEVANFHILPIMALQTTKEATWPHKHYPFVSALRVYELSFYHTYIFSCRYTYVPTLRSIYTVVTI